MKKPTYKVEIDLTEPESHRARVQISAAAEPLPSMLKFPVWTPGSYLVREYARHITKVTNAEKSDKNTWSLKPNSESVSYEVYCFERSVRTSFADENYITLVGATLLPLLEGPFEVALKLPDDWKFVSSALKFKKKSKGVWLARVTDFDHWVDCPIVSAAPGFGATTKFRLKGITHHIAWVGLQFDRPMKDLVESFQKIAKTTIDSFGGAPFKEYFFLLHFGHKLYGGLEHRDSQLSQFDGTTLYEPKDWDAFQRLIAHEYLHAWNVKSLRPKALGPFNYFAENYTQDIWFAEGITDYLDDLLCWQAGLFNKEAYLKSRLKDVNTCPDGAPGQTRRSLAEASFDAWIRYYRPDEDSYNTDVSYYSKGSILGWCWDGYLKKKSRGRWNLQKLMRAIWREFGIDAYEPLNQAKSGFTRHELFAFCEKTTKIPHLKTLENWVTNRSVLPWQEAARMEGIRVSEKVSDWYLYRGGFSLQWKGSTAVVQRVVSGSSAESAGLSTNDEIIAIGDHRLHDAEKSLSLWKRASVKQSTVQLLVCRLDKILTVYLKPKHHKGLGIEYALESKA